jgi:hypothetical protein
MPTKIYRSRDLPITIPLTCQRGDTLRSPLYRHKDPVTGLARDLTGCTIAAPGTLADGTIIDLADYLVIDLVGGRYRLIIPPAISNGVTPWPVGFGTYCLTITDTLSVVTTYFAGPLGLKEVSND